MVTADSKSIVFGQADPAFTYTKSPSVALSIEPTCTVSGPHTAVGTYPITCSGGADTNYTISYTAGTLTITAAPLMVTANNQSKAYGASDPTFTYTKSPSVALSTEPTCTVSGPHTAVGTYPITCSGAADSNYTISYTAGTLTVTAAPLMVTANHKSTVYGNAEPTFTYTKSPSVALATEPTCT